MDNEYFLELKKAFLTSSQRSHTPLLAPSPLFNMPYREVSERDVRDFMYLYARFKHGAFSSFHNEKIPRSLVDDLNTKLRVAVQKNQDLAQAIHSVLEKHSAYLDTISIAVLNRQNPKSKSSVSSGDKSGFFKHFFEFLLIPIEILIAFIGSK